MKRITLLFALLGMFFSYGQTDTVTFKVDLNNYSGSFTSVYVNGTFNSWCGSCNPMTDSDMDGIWEVALPLPSDTIEYKFTLDGWAVQEILAPGSPCTQTTGPNTNRLLIINGNTVLPVVCWNSCGICSASTLSQIDMPITWEDTATVDYTVTDFGGNISSVVVDPTNASNLVLKSDKPSTSQTWAGTTLGTATGFANAIPFAAGSTTVDVDVWSADAGITVRLKVEDATDATITCEADATTTLAGGWQTLSFDFSNQATGTAALNLSNTYDKMSIFYNFNVVPTATETYYCDNIVMGTGGGPTLSQIDMPITWEDTATVDYTVTDFGGNISSVVVDPTNASNLVLKSDKPSTSQTWAGTTLGTATGFANAIPFAAGSTTVDVDVWSADAGITVRLKVEDATDATITCEADATTTLAGGWQTLSFDFSNQATGTAALNLSNTYDKMSIFYNFNAVPTATETYYCDNVVFGAGGPPAGTHNVTFRVDMNYYPGAFTTPELNGDFNNWCGNCAAMTDVDLDGIWEIQVPISADSIEYKFSFDNWTGQEALLPGSPCTKTTGPNTNRFMHVTKDTILPEVCWGSCMECTGVPTSANVTFKVDLSEYTGSYTQVNLNGSFNNWCGTCTQMTSPNNDSIYEVTVLVSTDTIEYKFTLDGWTTDEQLTQGDFCTLTTIDGANTYTNRFLVTSADTTLPAVCWESCLTCNSIGLDENWGQNLTISPNPSTGLVALRADFDVVSDLEITVTDIQGRVIFQEEVTTNQLDKTVDLRGVANGMYMIHLASELGSVTEKVLITH